MKDGGPAFPLVYSENEEGDEGYFGSDEKVCITSSRGMSLRDWFAGKALVGQLAFSPHDSFEKAHQSEEVAALCYRFADAMIAEREKRGEK